VQFCSSKNLRIICETLNALFDIYSETDYDEILKQNNFISTFKPTLKVLNAKIKAERKDFDQEEV